MCICTDACRSGEEGIGDRTNMLLRPPRALGEGEARPTAAAARATSSLGAISCECCCAADKVRRRREPLLRAYFSALGVSDGEGAVYSTGDIDGDSDSDEERERRAIGASSLWSDF